YPTVLVSTMFYLKHKIVTDEDHGVFDKAAAEKLWNTQEVMGDTTGNPYFNQLVGETPEAIKKYIDWFVNICDDVPFLVDSSDGHVRAVAAKRS
ncbi:MAG: tetrahydromethanopterin S-methyltransferase subunit H, partial [Candidatus Methanoperedens sp.]|nr:tetrahydromethanopterin S-methyltransferase subunit H [Candidatus Methanoperedens sp.]